jgi:hypothetical protein
MYLKVMPRLAMLSALPLLCHRKSGTMNDSLDQKNIILPGKTLIRNHESPVK